MSGKGGGNKGFWDGFFDNPFGGIFDFNGDGKEDFGEKWLGYKIFEEVTKEEEEKDSDIFGAGSSDSDDEPDFLWRLICEDGSEYGIDPEDYTTEEDYEEALNEAKYAWRNNCAGMAETGIDPNDYETEQDYDDAVQEERESWRLDAEDGSDYGLDPEDFDTEEEYADALENAQLGADFSPVVFSSGVSHPQKRQKIKKESDYPNKRRYNAACVLTNTGTIYLNDEFEKKEKSCCRFILEKADSILAANYLSHDSGFLYAQAVKDHFTLSISLPDEDEKREYEFDDIILKISKRDIPLSFEIWAWCLEQFLPYVEYDSFALNDMTTDILNALSRFPEDYRSKLVHYMDEHPDFRAKILPKETECSVELTEMIAIAIREGLKDTAQFMFDAGLAQAKGKWKEINEFVSSVILYCKDGEEVESIEYFRDEMFGKIKEIQNGMVQDEIGECEKEITDYIESTEQESDRYAYSRRNAWRKIVPDGKPYGLDPVYFSSEQEYMDALEEEKHGWRQWYEDRDNAGLDLADYETQDEFRKAYNEQVKLQRRKEQERRESEWKKEQELKEQERKARRAALEADKTIYTYCGVLLPFSDRPYSFISDVEDIQIGDTVVVPVGEEEKEMEGEVVSVGRYSRLGVPFPVEKTKHIRMVIPKEL